MPPSDNHHDSGHGHKLLYDWNHAPTVDDGSATQGLLSRAIELHDETLRDGLQSPSVRHPSLVEKLQILHHAAALGIDSVSVGLPAAGDLHHADSLHLVREIADQRLKVSPNAAARTTIADCERVLDIAQQVGIAVEVAAFIGSSPIRQHAEDWDLDHLLALTEAAASFCIKHSLPFLFVTEDTTRSRPEDLRRLYTVAIEAGAQRVCIADTVGQATPAGARALVHFVLDIVRATGEDVSVDWHGHEDRGLSVACALAAAEAGASRLHGTALGIGERVGNTPIDLLLVNLELEGASARDLGMLQAYCRTVADATGIAIPDNHPVSGRNAYRTATGTHAAAIAKARGKGTAHLADHMYSSVPAYLVGRDQCIEIGPLSGSANVVHWLVDHGYTSDPTLVGTILAHAKQAKRVLQDDELHDLCGQAVGAVLVGEP